MQPQTALITGGAGFIGSHLAAGLVHDGYRVRILDSLIEQVHGPNATFPAYLPTEVERICGDVRDSALLDEVLDGVDVIFHLAALTGVGQSMYQIAEYNDVNSRGTAVLLQALVNKRQPIQRFVLASSRAVYGEGLYHCPNCGPIYPPSRDIDQLDLKDWDLYCPDCGETVVSMPTPETAPQKPASIYALTKRDQEDMVHCVGRAFDFPYVILRFFNVYGPHQAPRNPYTGLIVTFLNGLLSGQTLDLYEDGQMTRDFVHVLDVVQALKASVYHPEAVGEVINVGSGTGVTVAQIADMLISLTGGLGTRRVAGVSRVGDVRHMVADLTAARGLIGYEPQVDLHTGLVDLVEWFVREGAGDAAIDQAKAELIRHGLLR